MKPNEFTVCLLTGALLIVFGLVPGLLQTLARVVAETIQNFHDSNLAGPPATAARHEPYDEIQRPLWVAGIGALLIVLSVLTYLSN